MKHISYAFLATCLITTCMVNESYAFRCGDNLVSTSDSVVSLDARCGKPSWKTFGVTKYRGDWISVEKWFYNCGKDDFIYELQLLDGRIIADNALERGAGKSNCLGRQ